MLFLVQCRQLFGEMMKQRTFEQHDAQFVKQETDKKHTCGAHKRVHDKKRRMLIALAG